MPASTRRAARVDKNAMNFAPVAARPGDIWAPPGVADRRVLPAAEIVERLEREYLAAARASAWRGAQLILLRRTSHALPNLGRSGLKVTSCRSARGSPTATRSTRAARELMAAAWTPASTSSTTPRSTPAAREDHGRALKELAGRGRSSSSRPSLLGLAPAQRETHAECQVPAARDRGSLARCGSTTRPVFCHRPTRPRDRGDVWRCTG